MEMQCEEGKNRLEILIAETSSDNLARNEATTRLHLIDVLLFECLGWKRDSVILEENYGGQYTDYSYAKDKPLVILEAKKEGTYFEIPISSRNTQYKLATLLQGNEPLRAAIRQVRNYCNNRGVPLAAICNGRQLLIFVATRTDGIPPEDGTTLIFASFDEMRQNFLALWNILSHDAVQACAFKHILLGKKIRVIPAKLSQTIDGYPGFCRRNPLQIDLQILSELVIEDIARHRELEDSFLEACYCPSGALSQYALVSKEILQSRYCEFFTEATDSPSVVPATTKKGLTQDLLFNNILQESLAKRPIMLLGDVGSGKTMFIRWLMRVVARDIFDRSVGLYIDLGSQGILTLSLREFVLNEICRQLQEKYDTDVWENGFVRAVLHPDLSRFVRGINAPLKELDPNSYMLRELDYIKEQTKDKADYLRRAMEHISRGRKQQIIIFLDNADQRDFAVQQEAFLIAQEIAEHWPGLVYVAIRPETFYLSKTGGALSAYHAKAFTVAPPRVDEVLKKRLSFALNITNGEIPLSSLQAKASVKLEKLDIFIRAFIYSIEQNADLLECIDNIASGNIRLALDFVQKFFGSGHVNSEKIINIYLEQKSYKIPLHEFMRAIIYGDHVYYDPTKSPLINVFDVNQPDRKEHFLTLLTLSILSNPTSPAVRDGFVDTDYVIGQLRQLGFVADQIEDSLRLALRRRIVESPKRTMEDDRGEQTPQLLRVTMYGQYHLQRLPSQFAYVDAIVVDTPILDDNYRSKLLSVSRIEDRINRALIFKDYLDNQWQSAGLEGAGELFNWPNTSQRLDADIKAIRHRLNRGQDQTYTPSHS